MAERGLGSVITVGAKGSSLASSAVAAISDGLAQVRVDSSALDRLASALPNQNHPSVTKFQIPIPKFLSIEETRAFLVVLLNQLLLVPSSSSVRPVLPILISEALNSRTRDLGSELIDVTEEERVVLENLSLPSVLIGVCAVLDDKSTALSTIADAVAALSCEASGADVAAFNSIDSGDGFTSKEEIGVAGDLKVLLNGSKLVGKVKSENILLIPKIYGVLRELVKSVHSRTRIELNSSLNVGLNGTAKVVGPTVFALASGIYNLGESSLCRVKTNLNSINNDSLTDLFENVCLSERSLGILYQQAWDANFEKDYVKFVHEVNVMLGIVWKIITWELVIAFVALEGGELRIQKVNGGDAVVDEKSEKKKKKKKKVVLGKGTGVLVQLIKDRLQSKGLGALEEWVIDLFLFLDPKDSEFDALLTKIKEIVESNESRRLPKLPKVMICHLNLLIWFFL